MSGYKWEWESKFLAVNPLFQNQEISLMLEKMLTVLGDAHENISRSRIYSQPLQIGAF